MGKFEFRKNVIELDIEGEIYEVPGDTEYFKKLTSCGEKMVEHSKSEEDTDLFQLTEFMTNILDEMLGDDVVDSIFADREPEYYDCLDLFNYITEEIKAHHQKKMNALMPNSVDPVPVPISQNRAARRAAQRRKNK